VFSLLPGLGLAPGRDIALLGTVPDTELPSWFAAADVFAFPSAKEGWGLAVLEAMSAALPVVASDLPVFREYLTSGRDALLVPVGDPAALAGGLASGLGDRRLAPRAAAGGPGRGGRVDVGSNRGRARGDLRRAGTARRAGSSLTGARSRRRTGSAQVQPHHHAREPAGDRTGVRGLGEARGLEEPAGTHVG